MTQELSLPNAEGTSETLRTSEISYRRLFEAAQDGILILDSATGRVIDVNPFLVKLLGFSHDDVVGKTVGDLSPFKDLVANQKVLEKLQKVGYVRYENLPLETWDGRRIAVEFVCNLYQAGEDQVIQCNIRDITARKRMEEEGIKLQAQLLQSQKMASIGTLAGGVAHDTNNVLGAILDDDELIQSSNRMMLGTCGHTVTIASNGEEALTILEGGFQPDVVILDMNMPGMGGVGTLPRLRALNPNVPVLLATGQVDQVAMDLVAMEPHTTLLLKPYTMGVLKQYLEEALKCCEL